jgi:exosortase
MTLSSSYRLFVVLCAAPVLFFWHAIATTCSLSLHNSAYTHILLILPISAGLMVAEQPWRKWVPIPSFAVGGSILIAAALIGISGLRWGRAEIFTGDVRLSLQMLAVVLWWIGSFVVCFGGKIFRAAAFPLLFLLWLVPVPNFALDYIVHTLRVGSASTARCLLTLAGIPVAQDETVLAMPGLTIEVAKECSSIRSSFMLVVISMVMAHVVLRSFAGKVVVVLAAIPLSIVKNGLRVFTLSAISVYVDPAILNSPLHHQGGIVFLAVAVILLIGLLTFVSWVEGKICNRREMVGSPIPAGHRA